jgi:hypothetical protein
VRATQSGGFVAASRRGGTCGTPHDRGRLRDCQYAVELGRAEYTANVMKTIWNRSLGTTQSHHAESLQYLSCNTATDYARKANS